MRPVDACQTRQLTLDRVSLWPTLETTVNGLKLPNPFVIGSGPPGTNANVICKALEEGWGAVICKTVSLDAGKVVNVQPRYARLRSRESGEIYGWENIELISDRSFETWIEEFKQVKDKYPGRHSHRLDHGGIQPRRLARDRRTLPGRRVAMRSSSTCRARTVCPSEKWAPRWARIRTSVGEVCGWVMEVAKKPVWAKMTPNVTHIEDPTRASLRAGCDGIAAINTIRSVLGVDLETLRPEPTVEGYTTPGGYSCQAVMPIALRMCMEIAKVIQNEFPGQNAQRHRRHRNGQRRGPIHSARLRYRASLHRRDEVRLPDHSRNDTSNCWRSWRSTSSKQLADFKGHSLQYFTTHADLVNRQAKARAAKKAEHERKKGIRSDAEWEGDDFVKQTEALARG